MSGSGSSDASRLYECQYCKEKFHPLLAHDLHVLSKHATEWASKPAYPNSGTFSLDTKDLIEISQRTLKSLKSMWAKDLNKSNAFFQWIPSVSDSVCARLQMEENGKKKRDEKDDRDDDYRSTDSPADSGFGSGNRGREMYSSTDRSKRRHVLSTSTNDDRRARSSSSGNEKPKAPISSHRRNTTTFVARNIGLSRKNRMELVGKPYYLQRSPRRDDHRPSNRSSAATTHVAHAFRYYPKSGHQGQNNRGAIYVFQPSDAADLLRNLTWKATKALRQKQRNGAIGQYPSKGSRENGGQAPRFKRHHHSLAEKNRTNLVKDRNGDRRYTYEIDRYKSQPSYNRRITRGRIYDARLSKVQAESASTCEIKNSIHLYSLQTPAGDYSASLKEILDGRKCRGQSKFPRSTKSSK